MIQTQIISLQLKNDSPYNVKRIMIEKLGEHMFRIYRSHKEEGVIFSPFRSTDEIYDSALSALFSEAFCVYREIPIDAQSQTFNLLSSNEIAFIFKHGGPKMSVITHNAIFKFGAFAKYFFVDQILQKEDGGSFHPLQTVQEDTLEKIKELPFQDNYDEKIKFSMIESFKQMQVGDKFLCTNDWIDDNQEKKYLKNRKLFIEGYSMNDARSIADCILFKKK